MTEIEKIEHEHCVGDILTCDDKSNNMFRRDLVVVYVDLSVVGIVTDGLEGVYLIDPRDKSFPFVKKGIGALTPEQEEIKEKAIATWPVFLSLKKFPDMMKHVVEQFVPQDQPVETEHLVIAVQVPKKMVRLYREFGVLMRLVVDRDPSLKGTDVEYLTAMWMLNSLLGILPSLMITRTFGGKQEPDAP